MIKTTGKVIVTEELVTVTEFHFEGIGPKPPMSSMDAAGLEAFDWAIKRLERARAEASAGNSFMEGTNLYVGGKQI